MSRGQSRKYYVTGVVGRTCGTTPETGDVSVRVAGSHGSDPWDDPGDWRRVYLRDGSRGSDLRGDPGNWRRDCLCSGESWIGPAGRPQGYRCTRPTFED